MPLQQYNPECNRELSLIARDVRARQSPLLSLLFVVVGQLSLFQDGNQQDQNNNQDNNSNHLFALPRGPRDPVDLPLGPIKPALVAIDRDINIIKHGDLVVQLVPDLHAQLALARYARAEAVELLVLLLEHALVVRMDLHVAHAARLVVVAHRVVRVVAVPVAEELRLEVRVCAGTRRVIREAHRLRHAAGAVLWSQARVRVRGAAGRFPGRVFEVWVEGGIVRVGQGLGGRW